jgi:ubiquinone/menaquinone biosynthesis C-methylase UbiE
MLLSKLERWYVNGWVRGALQRPLELALLGRLYPFPRGAQVLDIGCGDGRGLVALAKRVAPLSLVGVDADPRQVAKARQTLAASGLTAQILEASAETLPLPAQTYDVVTSFGCLHHVPNWRGGVAEVARVLRHGGMFYGLEFYAPLLETGVIGAVFQRLFPHPAQRFTHAALLAELAAQGLVVLNHTNLLGLAGLVVARRVAGGGYD